MCLNASRCARSLCTSAGVAAITSACVLLEATSALSTAAVVQSQRTPKYTFTKPLRPVTSVFSFGRDDNPASGGSAPAMCAASHSLSTRLPVPESGMCIVVIRLCWHPLVFIPSPWQERGRKLAASPSPQSSPAGRGGCQQSLVIITGCCPAVQFGATAVPQVKVFTSNG